MADEATSINTGTDNLRDDASKNYGYGLKFLCPEEVGRYSKPNTRCSKDLSLPKPSDTPVGSVRTGVAVVDGSGDLSNASANSTQFLKETRKLYVGDSEADSAVKVRSKLDALDSQENAGGDALVTGSRLGVRRSTSANERTPRRTNIYVDASEVLARQPTNLKHDQDTSTGFDALEGR
jgi:hypothetical protein